MKTVRVLVTKWSNQDEIEVTNDEYAQLIEWSKKYDYASIEYFIGDRVGLMMDTVSIEITDVAKEVN